MSTAAHRLYVVQSGDCLWNIAKTELGDPLKWPSIAHLNHLKRPDHILVGQKLYLPDSTAPTGPAGSNLHQAPSPSGAAQKNKATITPSAVNAAPSPTGSAAANKATQAAPAGHGDHNLAQHTAFPVSVVYDAEFPAKTVEYDVSTPTADIHVKINYKLKFKLVAQDASGNPKFSLNQQGKLEFKQAVSSQLSWLSSNAKFGVDLSSFPPTKLEFMSGLTFLNNGRPIGSVSYGLIYKNTDGCGVKFTLESGQIDHVYQGIKYIGKIAIDAEVFLTVRPKMPPHPVPVPVYVPNPVPVQRQTPVYQPPSLLDQAQQKWDGLSTGQKVVVGVAGVVIVAAVVTVALPEVAAAAVELVSGEAVAGAVAWARGLFTVSRAVPALAAAY